MTTTAALEDLLGAYRAHMAQGHAHRRTTRLAPALLAAGGLALTAALAAWLVVSTRFDPLVCCVALVAMPAALVGALRLLWQFDAEIGVLGTATIKDGIISWQTNVPVGNDSDDVEPGGNVDVFQGLGLASMPFPKDDDGYAEAVFLRDCGGRDKVCVGARDTRNGTLVGKLKPGDTTMHSTGPGSVSQVFCKHTKRQAGLATDDADKKTMMFLLDGKNKKSQWTARGAMVQIDEDGSIIFTAKRGASLKLDDKIYFLGDLSIPGLNPGMVLLQALPTPSPGGAGSLPFAPVMGTGK